MAKHIHKQILDKICNKHWLTPYKLWWAGKRFTYLKTGTFTGIHDIGYIEQIPQSKKYMKTVLVRLNCFDPHVDTEEIENDILELYKTATEWQGVQYVIDTTKQTVLV